MLATSKRKPPLRLWRKTPATQVILAMREALRSGGLYIAESRHHVSFSNLIYVNRALAGIFPLEAITVCLAVAGRRWLQFPEIGRR